MIGIIDYGAGNTTSVKNALSELGVKFSLTSDSEELDKCDKIIFPGVGEASSAMKRLKINSLDDYLGKSDKPVLGICLGMQLLFDRSEENNTQCLGVIAGKVTRFNSENMKVPHMGWSKVKFEKETSLFDGIKTGEYFYFANSYYAPVNDFSIAATNYNGLFSSAVNKGNFWGVQFHPEKSGKAGLKLLENFIKLC
ncbi:MAG: imidazole glycerol phosphate synthase subunit HisH [Melioribacteraceae bacterium]|nr:MAG: imidazole glycerol phosphate synthase subunit HisH [Melioribacteraceae bacterium]